MGKMHLNKCRIWCRLSVVNTISRCELLALMRWGQDRFLSLYFSNNKEFATYAFLVLKRCVYIYVINWLNKIFSMGWFW